ncbi:MAG: 3-hydroxyacyl-CoA dehydrogenase NAD-binding domain-containing protein [Phycisphaerales bacterium]
MSIDPSVQTGTVLIMGAGTMGAGIAQVAATHGWHVRLADLDRSAAESAIEGIDRRLARLVEKGRMDEAERAAVRERLVAADDATSAADGCDLLIEAIIERLDAKGAALDAVLPRLPSTAIIATNTSSLGVAELGERIGAPERTVGMHFFNPAPLLKLVEVIPGTKTDPAVVARTRAIAEHWGKVVAIAADTPGFIVNQVARPYYLEAFRVLADGIAPAGAIDDTMRTIGRFRMGPLELTDLIGQDVNTATTREVWSRLGEPALLAPSPVQEELVKAGTLGRKSGRGVYDHAADSPAPAISAGPPPAGPILADEHLPAFVKFVAAAAEAVGGTARTDPAAMLTFARILVALVLQARFAESRGTGTAADIDTALRFGVNYPLGPLAWADAIGEDRFEAVRSVLAELPAPRGGERFGG